MILPLILATVAACSNYWVGVEEILRHKGAVPPLNISKETLGVLTKTAYEKAQELGFDLRKLDLSLYSKDDYFLAFFRPVRIAGEGPLGGDLLIILDSGGKVLCFFKGA